MLTIESASNPVWGNLEHTIIELQVKFAEFNEVLPFGATSHDPMPYGVELYNRAMAGEFGPIGDYVPPQIAPNQPATQGTQTL